jgi:hypothetical protein
MWRKRESCRRPEARRWHFAVRFTASTALFNDADEPPPQSSHPDPGRTTGTAAAAAADQAAAPSVATMPDAFALAAQRILLPHHRAMLAKLVASAVRDASIAPTEFVLKI